MNMLNKHQLLLPMHIFIGFLFILFASSCVSTSTYDAQVQKADSLQKVLLGVIGVNNQLNANNAGNLAIISDLNEEIRLCKEKVRSLEQQVEQATKSSSE
ncbi:MAG: hypothetical protein ACKOAK_01800, partial [Ignavibacteria bacterium]